MWPHLLVDQVGARLVKVKEITVSFITTTWKQQYVLREHLNMV
ncbi:hypothetical protein GGD46_005056 [Rhizobium lusitanum]|uniref:Uncharacterized protein n=1 Tax=Rhizobium lusitanum TaxID=293958 RepID=A0A7X0MEQ7_9HYPH|nr:hypothetical protein [Rhizobium lusitanum]